MSTVEAPASDHLKCEDLLVLREQVAEENWTTGLPSESKSQHIYFLAENLLHAILTLRRRVVPRCHWKFFV